MLKQCHSLLLALCILLMARGIRADVILVQQNVGYTITLPDIIIATDHISGLTGQTGTCYLSRVTGSSGAVTKAASTNSLVETDSVNQPGDYTLTLTATETGALGYIKGYYKSTNSDPCSFTIKVVAYNPDDVSLLGLTGIGTLANQTTLIAGQATITAKTNLIATNAADSANQIATQNAFTTFNTLFGTRIPGIIQPQTGDSYARLATAIVLPTTPPTGYALPGYYYAPVLDSGSAGVTSLVVTVTNPTNSTTSRLINWTVDSLATSYKVMRSIDGINYTKIATIAAGTLAYTDASRPAGTVYYTVISVH